jgi:hypothetical protein
MGRILLVTAVKGPTPTEDVIIHENLLVKKAASNSLY